uniref:Retrotransposon gag domain-containing protein n=1 Tax=Trichuris muris TaxID=70415 RepID=A0A5S6Q1R7_TRIMR
MEGFTGEKPFDLKIIAEFDGSSQRVAEWLEKFELVCELFSVRDLARVLPLRLTGGAFTVYQQLAPLDRKKYEKVKQALLGAQASPDVFLGELRRLASLFGGVSETAIGCAFVTGLPEYVQDMLTAGARMEDLSVDGLLTRARAMMVKESIVESRVRTQPYDVTPVAGLATSPGNVRHDVTTSALPKEQEIRMRVFARAVMAATRRELRLAWTRETMAGRRIKRQPSPGRERGATKFRLYEMYCTHFLLRLVARATD